MSGAAATSGLVETGSTTQHTAAPRLIPIGLLRTSTVEPHEATPCRTGKPAPPGKLAPDNQQEVRDWAVREAADWEVARAVTEASAEEPIERAARAALRQVDAVAAAAAALVAAPADSAEAARAAVRLAVPPA